MQITRITDPQVWDRALLDLSNPHVLQSWKWGEFKARHGWRATRLLFEHRGEKFAAASVLQRRLPGLPVSIFYVPKGPALDWTDSALVTCVLQELEQLARSWKAVFVKIDPDLYYPDQVPGFSPRPACAQATASMLEARGWCFSNDQIQFRNTLLLDLTCSEDELLAGMKQKTRYNVRLATRRGVSVRQATIADLDLFYQLYLETSRRDGFAIRTPDYYLDVWGSFMEAGLAHLLLAEVENEIVAGLMLFCFGPSAWYMYGASVNRHRNKMPNYVLQWEAIRHAKAVGCSLYDLWGAPDQLDASDPMWGVMRFKVGLGGKPVQGLGAWDYPPSQRAYRFYAFTLPRYLGWLRGRRGTQGTLAQRDMPQQADHDAR